MTQQPTRRVKPYPATPADEMPIQMIEADEDRRTDYSDVEAIGIVAGIVLAIGALVALGVELMRYAK